MNKVFLTIIVPMYEVEMYLDVCLKSVIKQDFSNYKVIMVDDGSPDKSGEIAKKYVKKYPYKFSLITQTNHGLGYSRNVAINLANSNYVFFLDSDDFISPNCLMNIYRSINNSNQPDILLLNPKIYNMKTKKYKNFHDSNLCENLFKKNHVQSCKNNPFLQLLETSSCRCVCKLDFLRKFGILFPIDVRTLEDVWFRILSFHQARSIAKYNYKNSFIYRVNSERNQNTKLTDERRLILFDAYKNILKKMCQEKWPLLEQTSICYRFLKAVIWCKNANHIKNKFKFYYKAHVFFAKYVKWSVINYLIFNNFYENKTEKYFPIIFKLPLIHYLFINHK